VSKRGVKWAVLFYEGVGFLLVMGVIWADELLDLPYYLFGTPGTVRWQEALWESGLICLLGVLTICLTYRHLSRIRYLEGFLPVCSYCKRIRAGEHWIPIEEYISDHSAAYFSHGLCPDCLRREYPEFAHKGAKAPIRHAPSSSESAK
jgi:hypothetical protein